MKTFFVVAGIVVGVTILVILAIITLPFKEESTNSIMKALIQLRKALRKAIIPTEAEKAAKALQVERKEKAAAAVVVVCPS